MLKMRNKSVSNHNSEVNMYTGATSILSILRNLKKVLLFSHIRIKVSANLNRAISIKMLVPIKN